MIPLIRALFTDPVVEMAPICPICALAAANPAAALLALSPVLRGKVAMLAFVPPAISISLTVRLSRSFSGAR